MSRRRRRRPQGLPLGRQAGLYVAARRPRPASPVCNPPQSYFSASTTGKNQYVRPRAPCTSAPPHADGGKWGGLDRDVVSRTAAARCLGSSEGRPARPKFVSQRKRTTDPDGLPSPPRARAALVRTGWPETAVGPPAAPRPAAHLHGGSRAALDGARSSAPGSSVPVVHGEAGRVAQRGRAVLPGGVVLGSLSRAGVHRAGWPGPPRGSPGGAPPALPGAARRGGAVPGHFTFRKAPGSSARSPYKTLLYFPHTKHSYTSSRFPVELQQTKRAQSW